MPNRMPQPPFDRHRSYDSTAKISNPRRPDLDSGYRGGLGGRKAVLHIRVEPQLVLLEDLSGTA